MRARRCKSHCQGTRRQSLQRSRRSIPTPREVTEEEDMQFASEERGTGADWKQDCQQDSYEVTKAINIHSKTFYLFNTKFRINITIVSQNSLSLLALESTVQFYFSASPTP